MTKEREKLEQLKKEYEDWIKRELSDIKSFSELAWTRIDTKKWNHIRFTIETGLNKAVYYDIKDKRSDKKFELETVVAFCVGIGATRIQADEYINAAGYNPKTNIEYQLYAFLFTKMNGRPIDEWNDYLEMIGKHPINRQRKNSHSPIDVMN